MATLTSSVRGHIVLSTGMGSAYFLVFGQGVCRRRHIIGSLDILEEVGS